MSSKIVDAIKSIDYKDLSVRALWTFLQAFLAVFLVVSGQFVDLAFAGDWQALYQLAIITGISAIAASLSALKTVVIGVIADIKAKSE